MAPPDRSIFRQRLSFWSIGPHESLDLIEARKNSVLETIYTAYARRLISRAFGRLRISGAEMPHGDRPVIAYMNHSAWWDAIVPVHLSHDLFRRDIHALMEAKQLRKYPFFRHLGFFGGNEGERGEARAVSEYAAKVLKGSRSSILWICPQGALFPPHVPLRFKSGLSRIAVAAPHATVVPVAFRYQFLRDRKPDCWVRIGEPVARDEVNIPALTRRFEAHLQREMDSLDSDIFREAATRA